MKWVVLMAKRKLYHLTFLPGLDGLSYRYKRAYYKWDDGFTDVMATEDEVKEKQKELVKIISADPFWPEMFTLWATKLLDIAPLYTKRISKIDFSKLENKKLLHYLEKIHEKMHETLKTVIFLNIDTLLQSDLENYLIERINKKKELLEVIECITSPTKISANIEQKLNFLNIKRNFLKKRKITKSIGKRLEKHVDDYGWVEMDTGHGHALTFLELKKRLLESETDQPDAQISNIKRGCEELKQRRQFFFEKYNIPADIINVANYLSESTYIRTYRRYSMSKLAWYSKPLHDEIARRLGLTWEELNYLTPWQVYKALTKRIAVKELKDWGKQNKKFSVGYLGEGGQIKFYVGKEAIKFASQQTTDEETVGGDVLHGRPVFFGKVVGNAKIVADSKDLNKVGIGDILVASQTPPDYIPALKRVAGVVVDEGGVTSHASILCREFKLPAIIGTRVATKTFKDDDRLSLDSTLGVVRKI